MACSKPPKETEGPNWLELPKDITTNILGRLDTIEIVTSVCQVCPLWWNICKDPLMWQNIRMNNFLASRYDLVKICSYAVDRSCGHLKKMDIERFCTDDLLKFIADRASSLQSLRISNCSKISDEGIKKVSKKFPLLEELDISFCKLSADSLQLIGQNCPLLNSLKFRQDLCEDIKDDEQAFAIAKTMSQLRHLDIYANALTNDGLIAILDGCSLLESLDLGECVHLDLSESLLERCREQIKELKGCRVTFLDYLHYIDELGDAMADSLSDSELQLELPDVSYLVEGDDCLARYFREQTLAMFRNFDDRS